MRPLGRVATDPIQHAMPLGMPKSAKFVRGGQGAYHLLKLLLISSAAVAIASSGPNTSFVRHQGAQSRISHAAAPPSTAAAATPGAAQHTPSRLRHAAMSSLPSSATAAAAAVNDHAVLQQRLLLEDQPQQLEQTPAQRAVARWYERQRNIQQLLAAGLPIPPPPPPPAPGAPPAGDTFIIPAPPPGTDIPAETQMPVYSPDQLRIRHKLIPGVPVESQVISLGEQMQQADALNVTLSQELLDSANPLLGPLGPVQVPEQIDPSEWPDGYVAICAIVKNQHKDIREWLEYHRWLGVQKVYVYDNNSTVPLASTIPDLLHSGFVEYAFFTGMQRYKDLFRTSSQWWAYNDCVHRFRHRHRWLAFIDADEFIMLQGPEYDRPSWQQQQSAEQGAGGAASRGNSQGRVGDGSSRPHDINSFLQDYEQYGGLAVNWVIFGSSGHKSRPTGGVLVNYHACLPDQHQQNTHVKVIANTKYLMTVGDDPHRVYYKDLQHFTVNELGQQVTQARTVAPSHTKIALYHYLTKSEQEYMQKMQRGSAAGNYKSPEFFYTIDQFATDICLQAVPLGLKCCPSVQSELGGQGIQQVKLRLKQLQQQQQQQQQLVTGQGTD